MRRQEVRSARRCRTSRATRTHSSRSRAGEEEPLLRCEVGCPGEAVGAGEAKVGAERVAHRVDEPVGAAWREAVFPPEVGHLDAGSVPVDPRFDPADEAVAEGEREYVIAPPALCRGEKALPHVLEVEQARE